MNKYLKDGKFKFPRNSDRRKVKINIEKYNFAVLEDLKKYMEIETRHLQDNIQAECNSMNILFKINQFKNHCKHTSRLAYYVATSNKIMSDIHDTRI